MPAPRNCAGYRLCVGSRAELGAFAALPGADLIATGIEDLERGAESVEALLASIGAHRLGRLGIVVPSPFPAPEHRLYRFLQQESGDAAHSRYNALLRRLVSFERAAECAG